MAPVIFLSNGKKYFPTILKICQRLMTVLWHYSNKKAESLKGDI